MSNNKERREESMNALAKEIKSRDRAEKLRPFGIAVTALVAILVLVGGVIYFAKFNNDSSDADNQAESSSTTPSETETPEAQDLVLQRTTPLPATVSCTYTPDASDPSAESVSLPATENIPAEGTVRVNFDTTQGPIPVELDRSVSPCTVNAITHLVSEGFYNDTICHRLEDAELHLLQCGSPKGDGMGGPGFTIPDEYPMGDPAGEAQVVNYPRGTIVMANTGQPNSGGSQFFLNFKASTLPPTYTYFGTIDESGLATLDALAAKGTTPQPNGLSAPNEEVRITSATVES